MKTTIALQTVNSDKCSHLPIEINNCGCYTKIARDTAVCRPQGRADYQLLLITAGTGHFTLSGRERTAGIGSMVLYLPLEPQIYRFEKNSSYFWLHFSGTQIDAIAEKHALASCIRTIENMPEAIDCFTRLIYSKIQHPPREEYACGLLLCLFSTIWHSHTSSERLQAAVQILLKSRIHEVSLPQLAQSCHMSVSHFSRQFKKQYGLSPHAYHLFLKIESAKNLLTETSLSVADIATSLGFDDPLYFSRVFKRACGLSPTKYRQCAEP